MKRQLLNPMYCFCDGYLVMVLAPYPQPIASHRRRTLCTKSALRPCWRKVNVHLLNKSFLAKSSTHKKNTIFGESTKFEFAKKRSRRKARCQNTGGSVNSCHLHCLYEWSGGAPTHAVSSDGERSTCDSGRDAGSHDGGRRCRRCTRLLSLLQS